VDEPFEITLVLDPGDKTDEIVGVARSECDGRKTAKLLFYLGEAQRLIGRTAPLFDLGRQNPALSQYRFDLHGVTFYGATFIELGVVEKVNAWLECQDGRITKSPLVVLIDEGIAVDQGDGRCI
jgi:hypothetical protein